MALRDLATSLREAAGAADQLAAKLSKVAGSSTRAGADTAKALEDAIKRGLTPELLEALRKRL
jgi:hypothetical protein